MATKVGMMCGWGADHLDEIDKWLGKKPDGKKRNVEVIQLHGGRGSKDNYADFRTSLAGALYRAIGEVDERGIRDTCEIHLSQPGWPDDGGRNLQGAAAGIFDEHHRELAENLADVRQRTNYNKVQVLRIAVEANGSWMDWYYDTDQKGKWFAQFFTRTAAIYRQHIPGVLIDFCFNRDAADPRLALKYLPSEAYDIVSIDFYHEQQYNGGKGGREFYASVQTEPVGVNLCKQLARAAKKKWAIPEFAPKSTTDVQGQDFTNAITDDVADEPDCAYVCYFNEPWNGQALTKVELSTDRPLTRAAFIRMLDTLSGASGTVPPVQPPAPTPTPEPPPVSASPTLDALLTVNNVIYSGKATIGGAARPLLDKWEGWSFWALAVNKYGGKSGSNPPAGMVTEPAAAVQRLLNDMSLPATTAAFTGSALVLLNSLKAALQGAVAPPVVTPPATAELVELKAALEASRAEVQASQAALALANRRLEAIKAALV
jgi:hypothetical protein